MQTLEHELRLLQNWCESASRESSAFLYNPKDFFVYFCMEVNMAQKAYQRNKNHAWNKKSYALFGGCYILASAASAFATQFALECISENPSAIAISVAFGILCIGGIGALAISWREKRAFDETWVRHSARYHRLRLALKQFLLSAQAIDDFNSLAEKTFMILERNLDQFELNISSNGLADTNSSSKEDA